MKPIDIRHVTHKRAFLGGVTSRVREMAVAMCDGARGVMLDVGCGNGLLFTEMGNSKAIRVGIDRSMQLLQEARDVLTDNHVLNVHLVRGDAFKLPFKPMCADWVCVLNTLLNISRVNEVEHLLREVMTVCRVGGRVIVEIRNGENPYLRFKYWLHSRKKTFPTRAYRRGMLLAFLEECGLRVIQVKTIGWPFRFAALSYLIEAERVQ